MKVQYIGAMRISGTKRENGQSYDFTRVFFAKPIQMSASPTRQVVGYGAEQDTLNLEPDALPAFANVKIGAMVDLKVEPDPKNPRNTICTGIAG